ncbi:hypothetical protein EAI_11988, partial [Harpegnathos saltator]
QFFNPNVCHICKATVAYNFITCDHCHMVTYCSQKHKQLHQLQHIQICMIVKEILNMDEGWDTRRLSKEEWIQSREELICLIKGKLSRDLEFHEFEMIMYVKSCSICRQQANLRTCMICFSTNYCNDHAEEFQSVHSLNCYNQFLNLNLEVSMINNISVLLKYTLLLGIYEPLIDMHTFIQRHLKSGLYKEFSNNLLSYNYLYSEFASGPLTLYHGLRDIMLFDSLDIHDSNYVIHIIGANHPKEYTPPWELFLHLLNHIRRLTVVITEVKSIPTCYSIDVCSHCKARNRIINIEYYALPFYNYVHINTYKRPNVSIGFRIDFNDKSTWLESVLKLREQNCPLFLTYISNYEAEECMVKLFRILNRELIPLYNSENKFQSLAPCRYSGSDD